MGIIYIAQNQTYGPNVYKVGKTERTNVRERMQELTGDTGVLGEFNELGWALVDDVNDCEKKCHTKSEWTGIKKLIFYLPFWFQAFLYLARNWFMHYRHIRPSNINKKQKQVRFQMLF